MSEKSHKHILKTTGIIGGSQVITIAVGILRTKFVAILLGPAGFGLVGLFQSIIELIRSITSFGIDFSAVRDIAESTAEEDRKKITRTYAVVYRLTLITGLLGAFVAIVFAPVFSHFTFGDTSYSFMVGLLSVSLVADAIVGGKSALIQGMMQISKIAKVKILLSVLSLVVAVPLYYFFRLDAVVPVIILNSLMSLLLFSLYAEKIDFRAVRISLKEVFREGFGMIRLGFYTEFVTFLSMLTMYIVKVFLTGKGGVEYVGYFQAAWSFSMTYLGAVLTAMSTDFFPRLSSVNKDSEKVRGMVNDQTEMVLFLAGPIIIGMLTFMPLVIRIFYSGEFTQTVNILQWQMMGDFLKVLSWPIGMILLAKNISRTFILVEVTWLLLFLCGIYAGWDLFGLDVTGISFFVSHLIYFCVLVVVVRKSVMFRYNAGTLRFIFLYSSIAVLAFLNGVLLEGALRYVLGTGLTVLVSVISLYFLNKYVDLAGFIRKKLGLPE